MEDALTSFYLDRAVAVFSMDLQASIDAINDNPKKSVGQKKMAVRMLLARRLGIKPQFRSGG